MSVVPLLVLCSLFLAACGVLLFVFSIRQSDHEHADRLSLLPLEDDLPGPAGKAADTPKDPASG